MNKHKPDSKNYLSEYNILSGDDVSYMDRQCTERRSHTKLKLKNDGISITNEFITTETCNLINQELDILYSPSRLSINGYLGHVFNTTTSKSIALPTASIRSINLLELAVDIAEQIQKEDPIAEHRVLTALEIWQ